MQSSGKAVWQHVILMKTTNAVNKNRLSDAILQDRPTASIEPHLINKSSSASHLLSSVYWGEIKTLLVCVYVRGSRERDTCSALTHMVPGDLCGERHHTLMSQSTAKILHLVLHF